MYALFPAGIRPANPPFKIEKPGGKAGVAPSIRPDRELNREVLAEGEIDVAGRGPVGCVPRSRSARFHFKARISDIRMPVVTAVASHRTGPRYLSRNNTAALYTRLTRRIAKNGSLWLG